MLIGTGVPLVGVLVRDIVIGHVGTRQYSSGLVRSGMRLSSDGVV